MIRLWRLSEARFASVFDGGYGLLHEGRWNRIGRPVTYASTSPSLCLLEKLVHVEDLDLLPPLVLIAYDIPDDVPTGHLSLDDLPLDWRTQEFVTQGLGNAWLAGGDGALLFVPSAVVPVSESPDQNILINHRHPAAAVIRTARQEPFKPDLRLR